MDTKTMKSSTKHKILTVATDLFYRQGYHATGVQQIIEEAGVSKGAFYTHFKTKDDLGLAYMRQRHHDEISQLKEFLAEITDPLDQYMQFNQMMKEWIVQSNYRGCAFLNMAAEVTDRKSPIRKEAKYHYEMFRMVIRDMVEGLLQSNEQYKSLDLQYVADQYMTIQIGAMTNAEIYQDTWPYDHAEKANKKLLTVPG